MRIELTWDGIRPTSVLKTVSVTRALAASEGLHILSKVCRVRGNILSNNITRMGWRLQASSGSTSIHVAPEGMGDLMATLSPGARIRGSLPTFSLKAHVSCLLRAVIVP